MLSKRENQIEYERPNGSLRVQIDCSQGGRTEQSHRDKCNINSIMAKAINQGAIPVSEQYSKGTYGDFSETGSYQEMQNKVKKVQEDFAKLPSKIRTRFGNDPGKLLDFMNDPRNVQEAISLEILPEMPIAPKPIDQATQPKPEPKTEPKKEP